MDDSDCARFLQWALPHLGLRWGGFRKVRRQVCKRLGRRLTELGLPDLGAYRDRLEADPEEWQRFERMTHVTISRFHRDRGTFGVLWAEVLPALAAAAHARGDDVVLAWSAGCASAEEPYTLAIGWQLIVGGAFPAMRLRVLASDVDETMLARARRGRYPPGSLRELPEAWRLAAFAPGEHGELCLRDAFREPVSIVRHDIRADPPPGGPFDLMLCRNIAFTYFDPPGQRAVASRVLGVLRVGGALVLGSHEVLPEGIHGYEPWDYAARIYRRVPAGP
jgi:chemotaxis protein methyltransferase CheR